MNTKKPILILGFTLLVVMVGYGMVLPVMPFYIEKLGAGGRELGWLMSTYSLMQLICAPLWGILSDRIGRKPVLTVGVLGYALTLFLFGLADQLWMLFVARTLSGILSSATMPTAMAYIGDHSPEKERSGNMGQLSAAMAVGVVAGPLLGGLLSSDSLSLPFFVGSGMAFIAFLLVIFVLPEKRVQPHASRRKGAFDRRALRQIFHSPAAILLLPIFIMSFGLTSFQGITGLYVVDRFQFDTRQVGAIWMVMGGVLVVVQGTLTGPLSRKFGEMALIRLGLLGGAAGFIFMTLAPGYTSILLALAFFSLSLALIGPALNGYISRFAGDRQGTVMGMNSAATSLGRVTGPLWAGYLYDINVIYPYISGAATLLVGLLVCLFAIRPKSFELAPA
jgi:DHA1 family multidrug resistance protein-like MFS transporter